LKYDSRSRL